MHATLRFAALLVVWCTVIPCTTTAAQDIDPEVERARATFAEGVQAAQNGDYATAADRFRAALEIRPSPAVSFNLAQALTELGEHAEAWELCTVIAQDESTPEAVREHAGELRTALQPQIGRLRITVGASDEASVEVRLDGSALDLEQLGREVAVSPGTHGVEAVRDGRTVSQRTIDVPAGGVALVDLSVVSTERIVEVERDPGPTPEPESSGGALLWVGIGGGVLVAAAVVVVVLLAGGGTEDPVQGNLPPGVITWR